MIYNFYIFNRKGACLYYDEWHRPQNPLADDPEEDRRLVFGFVFSLKEFIRKISPKPPVDGLQCMRTSNFAMHHYETASGLRFILNTDAKVADLQPQLKYIFSNIYVECLTKNPLYDPTSAAPITCALFIQQLRQYIESLSCFK